MSPVCSFVSPGFNFMFVLLWYVRQLRGLPAKVSLVQISCQLLPPRRWRGQEKVIFVAEARLCLVWHLGPVWKEKGAEEKKILVELKLIKHADSLMFECGG